MNPLDIRHVNVVQYINPLREGGSMPAIVKADDDFLYVLKFRGAGQGKRALIADLLGGEMARAIDMKVPELVFMHLDDSFGKTEPDEEIQDLLNFSVGLNLGLHYLSGSITYDPIADQVDSLTASKVILLDSIISNIDRTAKNTNLLKWNKELWLIDHGASFYFHHNWPTWQDHLQRTFPLIKNHVLLKQANDLAAAANTIKSSLNEQRLEDITLSIPAEWLEDESEEMTPDEMREAYKTFVLSRLNKIDQLINEIENAR
ncbi:MAG: aminotransferase class I and II [Schleiferiaceae bacterium]|jgi:hypothetical protein|nr:aminotransferase class I and II [Schleiferiaceae bacterium]